MSWLWESGNTTEDSSDDDLWVWLSSHLPSFTSVSQIMMTSVSDTSHCLVAMAEESPFTEIWWDTGWEVISKQTPEEKFQNFKDSIEWKSQKELMQFINAHNNVQQLLEAYDNYFLKYIIGEKALKILQELIHSAVEHNNIRVPYLIYQIAKQQNKKMLYPYIVIWLFDIPTKKTGENMIAPLSGEEFSLRWSIKKIVVMKWVIEENRIDFLRMIFAQLRKLGHKSPFSREEFWYLIDVSANLWQPDILDYFLRIAPNFATIQLLQEVVSWIYKSQKKRHGHVKVVQLLLKQESIASKLTVENVINLLKWAMKFLEDIMKNKTQFLSVDDINARLEQPDENMTILCDLIKSSPKSNLFWITRWAYTEEYYSLLQCIILLEESTQDYIDIIKEAKEEDWVDWGLLYSAIVDVKMLRPILDPGDDVKDARGIKDSSSNEEIADDLNDDIEEEGDSAEEEVESNEDSIEEVEEESQEDKAAFEKELIEAIIKKDFEKLNECLYREWRGEVWNKVIEILEVKSEEFTEQLEYIAEHVWERDIKAICHAVEIGFWAFVQVLLEKNLNLNNQEYNEIFIKVLESWDVKTFTIMFTAAFSKEKETKDGDNIVLDPLYKNGAGVRSLFNSDADIKNTISTAQKRIRKEWETKEITKIIKDAREKKSRYWLVFDAIQTRWRSRFMEIAWYAAFYWESDVLYQLSSPLYVYEGNKTENKKIPNEEITKQINYKLCIQAASARQMYVDFVIEKWIEEFWNIAKKKMMKTVKMRSKISKYSWTKVFQQFVRPVLKQWKSMEALNHYMYLILWNIWESAWNILTPYIRWKLLNLAVSFPGHNDIKMAEKTFFLPLSMSNPNLLGEDANESHKSTIIYQFWTSKLYPAAYMSWVMKPDEKLLESIINDNELLLLKKIMTQEKDLKISWGIPSTVVSEWKRWVIRIMSNYPKKVDFCEMNMAPLSNLAKILDDNLVQVKRVWKESIEWIEERKKRNKTLGILDDLINKYYTKVRLWPVEKRRIKWIIRSTRSREIKDSLSDLLEWKKQIVVLWRKQVDARTRFKETIFKKK